MLIPLVLALFAFDSPPNTMPQPCDPVDYVSPSGNHRLHVTAETRSGKQAALYEMFAGDDLVWSQRLGFCFEEAAVSDLGIVVGFADLRPLSPRGQDALVVAILDADGQVRMQEHTLPDRTGSWGPGPVPKGSDLLQDFDNDRFFVRVHDKKRHPEERPFWSFRISSGKRLGTLGVLLDLERQFEDYLWLETIVVPGTDLLLIRLWRKLTKDRGNAFGACFLLVDGAGKVNWKWIVPHDYETDQHGMEKIRYQGRLGAMQLIFQTDQEGQFEVGLIQAGERVRFQVEFPDQQMGEWLVKEVQRTPFVLPVAVSRGKKTRPELESVELQLVEAISLERLDAGSSQSRDPVPQIGLMEDLENWCLAAGGGFLLMRIDEGGALFQTRLSETGEFIEKLGFDAIPSGFDVDDVLALGADFWLATGEALQMDGIQPLVLLNGRTGQVRELAPLVHRGDSLKVEAARRKKDGDLVLLGTKPKGYGCVVVQCSLEGTIRWTLDDPTARIQRWDPIAIMAGGQVIVMDGSTDSLLIIGSDGTLLNRINLRETLDLPSVHVKDLCLGPDGRLLLVGFDTLWSMDLNGRGVISMTPHYPEPSVVHADAFDDAQLDRNGHIWVTNQNALVRLDHEGLAVEVLRTKATSGILGQIEEYAMLANDLICLRDAPGGNLHVWNDQGERLWIGEFLPGEADWLGMLNPSPTLGADGEVWSQIDAENFVGWSADGKRIGMRKLGGDLAFVPGSRRYWTWRYSAGATLHAADGEVLAQVDRLPDGRWLRDLTGISFGPNGEVYLQEASDYSMGVRRFVLECTADGQPIKATAHTANTHGGGGLYLPGQWRVPMPTWSRIFRPAKGGQPDQWLELTGPISERCSLFGISSDGEYLMSVDIETLTLFKQALPK